MTELNPNLPYCGFRNIDELNARMQEAFAELIVIPNSWLPEKYHDKARGGQTCVRLNQMLDKENGITKHVKEKATKARNIERMAAQVVHLENTGKMDFALDYSQNECDDLSLTRNMMALVGGMVNGGLLDAEELICPE